MSHQWLLIHAIVSTMRMKNQRLLALFSAASMALTLVSHASGASAQVPVAKPSNAKQINLPKAAPKHVFSAHIDHVGTAHVSQGQTKKLEAWVRNRTGEVLTGATAVVSYPKSILATGAGKHWKCAGSSGRLFCRHDGSIAPRAKSTFFIKVVVPEDAPVGRVTIKVTPNASQLPKVSSSDIKVTVIDRGKPRITPNLSYISRTIVKPGVVSGAHTAYVGKEFKYAISLKNEGRDSLRPGEVVTVSEEIGKGVRLVSVKTSAGNSCFTSKTKWICRLTPPTKLPIGFDLDTITVTVVPTKLVHMLAVGEIKVKTQGVRTVEKKIPVVNVEKSAYDIEVLTKTMHLVHQGGKATVRMVLQNKTRTVIAKNHTVKVKLPTGAKFVSGVGANWSCKATGSGRTATCTYAAQINGKKKTTPVVIVSKFSRSVTASTTPYLIQFNSSRTWSKHNIYVENAPVVKAVATPARYSRGVYSVGLNVEETGTNERPHDSQWVQRCVTSADARTDACPGHVVAPRVTIINSRKKSAIAQIPASAVTRKYVFEYRAITDSVSVAKTVAVKIPKVSATALAHLNTYENKSSVSAATTTPIIPTEVTAGLLAYGFAATGTVVQPSSTSMIQTGALTGNIAKQFSPIVANGTVKYSTTDAANACAYASMDSSAATYAGGNLKVKNVYIIAPKSGSSSCAYHGKSYTNGTIFLDLNVFGDTVTFSQTLNPNAFLATLNLVTHVATLNYPLSDTSFTFKNVDLTLSFDMAMLNPTLKLGVNLDIFGQTITLGGLLQWDIATKTFTGDLYMAQTRNFTFDGITVSNAMLGVGISYSYASWQPSLNVMGSGSLSFMGNTIAFNEISVDFDGDVIVAVRVDFALKHSVPNQYSFNGEFVFQWAATPTATESNPTPDPMIKVGATVQFSTAGGVTIGTAANPAKFSWTPKCFAIQGAFDIDKVLSADINGYVVTQSGLCDSFASTLGSGVFFGPLPQPTLPGDFRFDATHVKLNVPGLTSNGSISIGQTAFIPYGKIDVTTDVSVKDFDAKFHVNGDLDPLTGFSLVGSASVNIAGFDMSVDGSIEMTKTVQNIGLTGSLDVLGSTVSFKGDIGIDWIKPGSSTVSVSLPSLTVATETTDGNSSSGSNNPNKAPGKPPKDKAKNSVTTTTVANTTGSGDGTTTTITTPKVKATATLLTPFPHIELIGAAEFKPDGFAVGATYFNLIESYEKTGLTASASLNGVVFRANADFTFDVLSNGSVIFSDDVSADLDLAGTKGTIEVDISNCSDSTCTSSGTTQAKGTVSVSYLGDTLSVGPFPFNANFEFGEVFKDEGSPSIKVPDTNIKVVFNYGYAFTVSSRAPYFSATTVFNVVAYDGSSAVASAKAGVSLKLKPFKISVQLCIDKVCKTYSYSS